MNEVIVTSPEMGRCVEMKIMSDLFLKENFDSHFKCVISRN